LLAALCFCAVLGIALASYVGVCYQALQTSSRNNNSTHSLELAETGMEEALWILNQLNQGDNTVWATNGWSVNNVATPKIASKTLNGFSYGNGVTGAVAIEIQNYDGSSITAKGVRTITVAGTTTLSDGSTITRRLQASAQAAPLFVNAVAAVNPASSSSNSSSYGGVQLVMSGTTVESFDSNPTIPSGETAEQEAARKQLERFGAVVSSATNVTLVSAHVDGYVAVGADSNGVARFTYGSNAKLFGPLTPSSAEIDSSRLSTSPYQPVFDIVAPSDDLETTSPAFPASLASGAHEIGVANTKTYYFPAEVNLTGAVLTIKGHVTIVTSGNFMINEGQIVVSADSSLQVVMTGANKLVIGGDGIDNKTGNGIDPATNLAKNVGIFAAQALQVAEISTVQEFRGVIYAPKSDLVVSSTLQFYGSIVGKNVLIYGAPNIYYDLDLRRRTTDFSAIDTPFTVSSWQEIAP
jgi:hypothetical protein